MPIQFLQMDFTGESGVLPREGALLCNDTLSQVTDVNYLKSQEELGQQFYSSDIIRVSYTGGFGFFQPTFSNGNITLSSLPYSVIPNPVTSGNVAFFSNDTGSIGQISSLVDGNIIVGNGTGSIKDSGLKILYGTTSVWGGGGVTNNFAATGLTTTSIVSASIGSSTNRVALSLIQPTSNVLTVTFTADPGPATYLNWSAVNHS